MSEEENRPGIDPEIEAAAEQEEEVAPASAGDRVLPVSRGDATNISRRRTTARRQAPRKPEGTGDRHDGGGSPRGATPAVVLGDPDADDPAVKWEALGATLAERGMQLDDVRVFLECIPAQGQPFRIEESIDGATVAGSENTSAGDELVSY